MLYRKLWAKSAPHHPLWCHLLDVAAVCEALLPRFGPVDPIPDRWVAYLAALHDIGKADPLFQGKAPELTAPLIEAGIWVGDLNRCAGFRHEARSAEWIQEHLRARGWGDSALVVSRAIRGHHGDFGVEAETEPVTEKRLVTWAPIREASAQMIADALSLEPWTMGDFEDVSAAGIKLSGLIVLADWIASNHERYRYPQLPTEAEPTAYLDAARQEAREAVRRLELGAASTNALTETSVPPRFAEVWSGDEYAVMRPSQAVLEAECLAGRVPAGLAILEAPMGEGKTEAAIYLAEHWNRLRAGDGAYLALPTQATSNQMHTRYARFLNERHPQASAPHLIHGMAWLLDDVAPQQPPQTFGGDKGDNDGDEPDIAREWFQNAKRALLAPESVGTVDQALMAALNVKHGFLRFLGLSAKVLVIDEVHAYDAYMTTLMCQLLRWCRALKIPVVLLSATLAREQKRRLVEAYGGAAALPAPPGGEEAYPLLTFVPLDGPARVVPVESDPARDRKVIVSPHPGLLQDAAGTAALAAELVRPGGCACVLANTVKGAQDIFQALGDLKLADTDMYLFHARFRAEKRKQVEDEIVGLFGKEAGKERKPERPERAILVATQVVEQSLDVDFDVMLSQLAPIDLLLQRSGRLWRHAHNKRWHHAEPVLHVLLPPEGAFDFGPTGRVYKHNPEALLRTLALLHGRQSFDLPRDFRLLVEGCYGEGAFPGGVIPPELLGSASEQRQAARNEAESKATTHLIPEPSPRVFSYGQMPKPVTEAEDNERASYFRAQTRLGDETRAAIVLNTPRLAAAFRGAMERSKDDSSGKKGRPYWPSKTLLRRLFLQKVNLPSWWFAKVAPADGFDPLVFDGPRWLRHHVVIPMSGDVWRGTVGEGDKARPITLRDDPTLGLCYVVEGKEAEPEDASV